MVIFQQVLAQSNIKENKRKEICLKLTIETSRDHVHRDHLLLCLHKTCSKLTIKTQEKIPYVVLVITWLTFNK